MRALMTLFFSAFMLASPAMADDAALLKKGEKVYKKCKACHQVGPQAKNVVGPMLNDIVGRKAGPVMY